MFCKIPISIPLKTETGMHRYFARRYSVRCLYRVPVYSPISCNGPKKDRVGRSVKEFFWIIFLVKNLCFMHVLRRLGVRRA